MRDRSQCPLRACETNDASTRGVTISNQLSQNLATTQRKIMTTQLDKALALAAQEIHVFPMYRKTSGSRDLKVPHNSNGFRGATTDAQQILEWWTKWPQALVGYWTGASNLVVLDLDEKHGNSGEFLVASLELDYASDVWYRTPSGGSHHVFRAPKQHTIRPGVDIGGLTAVDVRAGGSCAIWYGEVPRIWENLRETPEWLLKRSRKSAWKCAGSQTDGRAAKYDGDIQLWIDWLSNDQPWFQAMDIEAAIDSKPHIGHDDLLKLVYRIHMTRLDGGTGLAPIFLKLVAKFKATTNNEGGWQRELDDIVRGAIGETWSPKVAPKTAEQGETK